MLKTCEEKADSSVRSLEPRIDESRTKAEVSSFLACIYREEGGRLPLVSGFVIGKRLHGVTNKEFRWPEDIEKLSKWAAHEVTLGREVFHFGSLRGLRSTNLLFGEMTPDELADLPSPTATVHNPNGLRQYFWRLDDVVSRRVAGRVAAAMHCGDGKLLRLPGSIDFARYEAPPAVAGELTDLSYMAFQLRGRLPGFDRDQSLGVDERTSIWRRPARLAASGAMAAVAVAGVSFAQGALSPSSLPDVAAVADSAAMGVGTRTEPEASRAGIDPSKPVQSAVSKSSVGMKVAADSTTPKGGAVAFIDNKVNNASEGAPGTDETHDASQSTLDVGRGVARIGIDKASETVPE